MKPRIGKVMQNVEKLLIRDPSLVNSDTRLIVEYLEQYHYVEDIREILTEPNIPSIESISRARRRLKKDFKAVESVEDGRREVQAEYVRYFG